MVSRDRACWEEGEDERMDPVLIQWGRGKVDRGHRAWRCARVNPARRQKYLPQNGQMAAPPIYTHLPLVLPTPLYLEHCLTLCPVSSLSSFCSATPQSQKHLCPSPGDCCSPVFIRIYLPCVLLCPPSRLGGDIENQIAKRALKVFTRLSDILMSRGSKVPWFGSQFCYHKQPDVWGDV